MENLLTEGSVGSAFNFNPSTADLLSDMPKYPKLDRQNSWPSLLLLLDSIFVTPNGPDNGALASLAPGRVGGDLPMRLMEEIEAYMKKLSKESNYWRRLRWT